MMHKFKKKYGQNFITDKELLTSIASDAEINEDSVVVEVGAGMGALTEVLAQRAKRVYSFEIDADLKPVLTDLAKKHSNLTMIFEDFMQFDLNSLPLKDFIVVANLPYYITTAIITKFLKQRPKKMCLMVQKEVAERLISAPHNSTYGAMTVLVSHQAEVCLKRIVTKNYFTPVPEVDSAIITLDFNENDYNEQFSKFVFSCFALKRKTLFNNLRKGLGASESEIISAFSKLNIEKNARPEDLSSEEFFKLFNYFKN